jgi:hypothetical protein
MSSHPTRPSEDLVEVNRLMTKPWVRELFRATRILPQLTSAPPMLPKKLDYGPTDPASWPSAWRWTAANVQCR